jgi:hypothetical protein
VPPLTLSSRLNPMSRNESALARIGTFHRPLVILTGAMAVFSVIAALGVIFDDRTLVNASIWLKPFKFTISIGLYSLTLAWMLTLLPKARRWGWWMGTLVAAGLAVDMVLIVWQVIFRVRPLHFNHADQLDKLMSNSILPSATYLVWVATLVVALLLAFQRLQDKAQAAAVRAGLGVALLGLALGMLMFVPTAGQQAMIDSGVKPAIVGAHSVGVPDGGQGLPLLGWSTVGGDLRIPHFVGIHALQLLPLFGMLLAALAGRYPVLRDAVVRRRMIRVAALGYVGLLAILTWQALRGQPIVHPDFWTLLAVAGEVAVVGIGFKLSMVNAPEVAKIG